MPRHHQKFMAHFETEIDDFFLQRTLKIELISLESAQFEQSSRSSKNQVNIETEVDDVFIPKQRVPQGFKNEEGGALDRFGVQSRPHFSELFEFTFFSF